MITAAPELPDDIETLKAMVLAARAETARQEERALRLAAEAPRLAAAKAQADARIDRLTAILKALERARFSRKSETLADGQQSFVFEEIETGSEARAGIGKWLTYYNGSRPHSALEGKTPEEVHTACDGMALAA